MKILLVYRLNIDAPGRKGVFNKLQDQKAAMINLGHQVDSIFHSDAYIFLNEDQFQSISLKSQIQINRFKWFGFFDALKSLPLDTYDLIYIRYPFTTKGLVDFLNRCKSVNSKVKIVLEMPTFPYHKEWKGIKKLLALGDYKYRNLLKRWVDRIVHYGLETEIFDIPTIKSSNGINLSRVPISNRPKELSPFKMIAIGKWDYWHGLDRIINGIADYIKHENKPVELLIIGAGREISKLKKITEKLDLNEYVHFLGEIDSEELAPYFDNSHLAIGTLGMHRKHVRYNSSLKHRDYCARGIPFVLSTNDDDFPKDLNFVCYVQEDDSPVQISELVDFYSLWESKSNEDEVRNYGLKNLSWESKLGRILEEF